MNGMRMACSTRFMPGGWLFSVWTIFFSPSGGCASMFSLFVQLLFPVVTVLYLRLWSAAGALLVRACTRGSGLVWRRWPSNTRGGCDPCVLAGEERVCVSPIAWYLVLQCLPSTMN